MFSDTFEECESRSVIIPVEENFPAFLEEIGYVWYDYEIFDVGFSEDGSEWINLSINTELRDAANALNTLAENMQLTAFILCILYILLALFIATVSILSKRREIALMRALGMTKFKVLGAYFGGILLLIIPVTVVALLLVFACVPFINNVVFGTVIGGHYAYAGGIAMGSICVPRRACRLRAGFTLHYSRYPVARTEAVRRDPQG